MHFHVCISVRSYRVISVIWNAVCLNGLYKIICRNRLDAGPKSVPSAQHWTVSQAYDPTCWCYSWFVLLKQELFAFLSFGHFLKLIIADPQTTFFSNLQCLSTLVSFLHLCLVNWKLFTDNIRPDNGATHIAWIHLCHRLCMYNTCPNHHKDVFKYIYIYKPCIILKTWWRHQMEPFSALLAFCVGNSPVTCGFSSQRPVTWSFCVFSDLRLNAGDLRRHRAHNDVIVMYSKLANYIP